MGGIASQRIGPRVYDDPVVYRGTVAGRPPDPSKLPNGAQLFFEDYPPFVGSYWRSVAGTLYSPLSGMLMIGGALTEVETDTSGQEQELASWTTPAGLLTMGFGMALEHLRLAKSGTLEGVSFRLRVTNNNSLPQASRTSLLDFSMEAAGPREGFWLPYIHIVDDTKVFVSSRINTGTSVNAPNANVTIPSLAENDLFWSLTALMSGVTETAKVETCKVVLEGA